jgi:transposase
MEGQQFTAYVGIDCSSDKHQVCIVNPEGEVREQASVNHSGEGLEVLITLLSRGPAAEPGSTAVAIEAPHGPVVDVLLERGFAVFSINPKQLDRFRDRYSVAGAKDDSRDAFVLADSLRTDQLCFKRVRQPSSFIIEIRELSRLDNDLQQEFNRGCNQLRELLNRYFPQLLRLSPAADEAWVWDLLQLAPLPVRAAKVRKSRIEGILQKHRIRRITSDEIVDLLKSPPLQVAPGTAEVVSERALLLVSRLQLLRKQRAHVAKRIDDLIARGDGNEGRDIALLRSFPGLGRGGIATLLAEAWIPLAERNYHAFRAYAGLAPVTRQSGKKCNVVMRYACNQRLRNACYHWSRNSIQRDTHDREHYARLRAAGHTHGRALRGIADRLAAILIAALKNGKPYDPTLRRAANSGATP